MRSRKGQSSVEYVLLLSAMLVVIQTVGLAISRYGRQVTAQVLDRIMDTAIEMASP